MDVLIVGGGPAGAIAALVLARRGVRVTVCDRAKFPRHKLCGDSINPGAVSILARLGLRSVTDGAIRLSGMIVSGEGRVAIRGAYPPGQFGLSLPRHVLDARLLEAAAAAGADIQEGILVRQPILSADGSDVDGVEVRLSSNRVEQRRAAVTIAADGTGSRIARALRLVRAPRTPRRWAIGGVFTGVGRLSSFGEMHVRQGCYIGVAPLPGDRANACIVTSDRYALRTPALLPWILRQEHEIGDRFHNAEMVEGPYVLGPLALDAAAAGMRGVLLAGDAAGFVDPMTGDGLRFAFRGGELAALEACRILECGWNDGHVHLGRARRIEFRAKWRFNRVLRTLVGSSRGVRIASQAASISPAVLTRAIRYAGDVRAPDPR